MRTYVELAAASFRRYSTYRLAIAAGVFTNSVFGFIRLGVIFGALGAVGGALLGYDRGSAATYVWLGQALLAPVALYGWAELAERVKSGEIAVDLARPVDIQLAWWSADLGRAGFQLLTRGIPPLVIGALVVDLQLAGSVAGYGLGAVSVLLAVSVSFSLRFLTNLAAFWVLDVRGLVNLYFIVAGPFAGLFVPIDLLPGLLRPLAYALPFAAMLQYPVDVLSGRASGTRAVLLVGLQLAWLAVLVAAGRLVLWRAARKLVVQGG